MPELTDFIPDPSNPNKGNNKGRRLIKESLAKHGAGRSILVDKNGVILAGNNVGKQAKELGMKAKVVQTTGDELVVVQRTDIDINTPEGRELTLDDNATAKQNITWDKDILKKSFSDEKLKSLNLEFKQIKSTPLRWIPDMVFKSSNELDIPDLLPDMAAGAGLVHPFMPWGSQKRSNKAGSYHFYVDDYRFQTIWDNPAQVIGSGCAAIVEPNFSTDSFIPMAYGCFLIFKKRYFARLMQENGIRVFVDVHVHEKFREINFAGLPPGWNAFATRGYGDDVESLQADYEQVMKFISEGKQSLQVPNMLVYGGGAKIENLANELGLVYLKPFTSKYENYNGQGTNQSRIH